MNSVPTRPPMADESLRNMMDRLTFSGAELIAAAKTLGFKTEAYSDDGTDYVALTHWLDSGELEVILVKDDNDVLISPSDTISRSIRLVTVPSVRRGARDAVMVTREGLIADVRSLARQLADALNAGK